MRCGPTRPEGTLDGGTGERVAGEHERQGLDQR